MWKHKILEDNISEMTELIKCTTFHVGNINFMMNLINGDIKKHAINIEPPFKNLLVEYTIPTEDNKTFSKNCIHIVNGRVSGVFYKTVDTKKWIKTYCSSDPINLELYLILCALLACKNTSEEIIFPSKKLNKRRAKRGRLPLYEYKILNVDIAEKNKKSLKNGYSLNSNRVHLCRGHFKNRKTGLYWWQPHLRGDKTLGFVDKEYRLKSRNKPITEEDV